MRIVIERWFEEGDLECVCVYVYVRVCVLSPFFFVVGVVECFVDVCVGFAHQ